MEKDGRSGLPGNDIDMWLSQLAEGESLSDPVVWVRAMGLLRAWWGEGLITREERNRLLTELGRMRISDDQVYVERSFFGDLTDAEWASFWGVGEDKL